MYTTFIYPLLRYLPQYFKAIKDSFLNYSDRFSMSSSRPSSKSSSGSSSKSSSGPLLGLLLDLLLGLLTDLLFLIDEVEKISTQAGTKPAYTQANLKMFEAKHESHSQAAASSTPLLILTFHLRQKVRQERNISLRAQNFLSLFSPPSS